MVLLLLVFERMQIEKTDVRVGYQTGDRPSSWAAAVSNAVPVPGPSPTQPFTVPDDVEIPYALRVLPISQHKASQQISKQTASRELTLSPTSISIVV
jgi:hypothetical protein